MTPLAQLQAQSEQVYAAARLGLITEEQKKHRLAILANGIFAAVTHQAKP
tara:strand:+ start:4035 stop:4184 length:150 start_codon:yes stop_codon:yes gene_type:complete